MEDTVLAPALVAWSRMKVGEEVVISDKAFDALAEHFDAQDGPEARIWFSHVSSRPNSHQVGTLDVYAVRITETGLSKLVRENLVEARTYPTAVMHEYDTTASFAKPQALSTLERIGSEMEAAIASALEEGESVDVGPASATTLKITLTTPRDLGDPEMDGMLSEIWNLGPGSVDRGTDLEVTFGVLTPSQSAVMAPGP